MFVCLCVYVCVFVCARVHACVRSCVCVCVCAAMWQELSKSKDLLAALGRNQASAATPSPPHLSTPPSQVAPTSAPIPPGPPSSLLLGISGWWKNVSDGYSALSLDRDGREEGCEGSIHGSGVGGKEARRGLDVEGVVGDVEADHWLSRAGVCVCVCVCARARLCVCVCL